MAERRELRVSDQDRQGAAERLRAAHDEGRLDFSEYDRRLADAYSSVTYGDLDKLFVDLPGAAGTEVAHVSPGMPRARARSRTPAPRWVPADPTVVASMPTALKVLWTIWASVVAINLTVWLLVSLGNGPIYFWPMWLLVPGSVLFAVTASVSAARRGRPAPPDRPTELPPAKE
jgi:Domain of unknown function (DUF1707)